MQPGAGETLTKIYLDGTTEIVVARTTKFVEFDRSKFEQQQQKPTIEIIKSKTTHKVLAMIIRDIGNDGGIQMSKSLQGIFGLDVLEGRGSNNKCSYALSDARITFDAKNYDSCSFMQDGFRKLVPIDGSHHGGNFGGDKTIWTWIRPIVEMTLDLVDGRSSDEIIHKSGSVQVIRYRSEAQAKVECVLPKKKNG